MIGYRLASLAFLVTLGACQGTAHNSWAAAARPIAAVSPREAPHGTPGSDAIETTDVREASVARPATLPPPLLEPLLYGPPGPALNQQPQVEERTPEYYRENIYRKWGVSLGGAFLASFNTEVQVSSPVLVGAILDMEDLLGVDSKSAVIRFDGFYSFNRRHEINFAYYDIRRSGSRAIFEEIEVGETIIPAGQVDTSFNTRIMKLAYRYNFVTDYRTVIGASAGFHTMGLDTSIRAGSGALNAQQDFRFVAPLPLIGLHGRYALSDKWRLAGGVETLRVEIGSVEGFIVDTNLSLEHDTFEHLGWGIGFNSFKLDVSAEASNATLRGEVNYGYTGLLLYIRSYF